MKFFSICVFVHVVLFSQIQFSMAEPLCQMQFKGLNSILLFDHPPLAPRDARENDPKNAPFNLSFDHSFWKNPTDPKSLSVWLYMEMCPKESSHRESVTLVRQEKGRYRVTSAYFTMPGPWVVKVQVGNEVKDCPVYVNPE